MVSFFPKRTASQAPDRSEVLRSPRPSSTPRRWSDMLAAFGAQKSPTSVAAMGRLSNAQSEKQGKPIAPRLKTGMISPPRSDADTHTSTYEYTSDTTTGVQNTQKSKAVSLDLPGNPDLLSEDEDTICVMQYPQPIVRVIQPGITKQKEAPQPRRSTRELQKRIINQPAPSNSRVTRNARSGHRVISSDTITSKTRVARPKPETIRAQTRQRIIEVTGSKRDAFLLAHEGHFTPVLPANNYLAKLKRANPAFQTEASTVDYEMLTKQPAHVTATMKPYQLEGLSFLVYMYRNGMSCILGDEMGLGKTLQTLSLFQFLAETEPQTNECRPHLVVCPLSVLSSWINEARRWVPKLKTVRFHGPPSEREAFKKNALVKNNHVDVVVTTYETFVSEGSWLKRAYAWRFCVLDEGHKIKNEKSDVSAALQSLQAEYRLLLTGTPLQNNLLEMWALLHWLYPSVFGPETADAFKRSFDLSKGNVSTKFMDDARRLLELVMLRRMKNSPNVNLGLPPKTEILLFVPLTPMQRFWYTRLITKMDNLMFDELFKDVKGKSIEARDEDLMIDEQIKLLEKGAGAADRLDTHGMHSDAWAESKRILQQTVHGDGDESHQGDWRKLMNLILQLRKVCNHPYLLKQATPDPYFLGNHLTIASGKFIVLDKIIDELVVRKRKKILIFSGFRTMLDLCEDLLMMKGANMLGGPFKYSRLDGATNRARRNLAIRQFNLMDNDQRIMLISTRAGGLGINLASASDVIFLDEDWNPQITLQAEARAHRIGQTQPVTIYKICTQGTVEEQMMGRIRKKLYLSAKITESMRNIHTVEEHKNNKRKRQSDSAPAVEDDAPKLGTSQLKMLLRRGAKTLIHPEHDISAMLEWDFDTMISQCRDKTEDGNTKTAEMDDTDEQSWLNSMERVETAVFEGRKHHRKLEDDKASTTNLSRSDRRVGKNTTVMVDGFAISKESMSCGAWEAVPTFAGKDPRLADPIKTKKDPITSQEHCQHCRDGGDLVCCSGCPRAYHMACLDKPFQAKAKGYNFFCPQHACADCGAKTTEAGGMLYRCRWCESAHCEDCLDWDHVRLVGDTIPEFELSGLGAVAQAHYVECPRCVAEWVEEPVACATIAAEREELDAKYRAWLDTQSSGLKIEERDEVVSVTPATVSEVATPADFAVKEDDSGSPPAKKKMKFEHDGF